MDTSRASDEAAHFPGFSTPTPGWAEGRNHGGGAGGMRARSVAQSGLSKTAGTRARRAPLSTGFSSRILERGAIDWVAIPPPGHLPNPGWHRVSASTAEPPGAS